MSGLKFLYNLILKDTVTGSGSASGILSIGKDVRKLANKKFQRYVTTAQKQGVDLDKLSEQEIKYMIELNKPKAPRVLSNEDAYEFLNKFLNQGKKGEVIRGKFKPLVTVDSVITDIKKLKPMDSMKETNKVLKGEGKYKNLSKTDREKIAGDESVTDHIFERDIPVDPEDFAYGGVAGMLGERTGFSKGKLANLARRNFMKLLGGVGAGIGALKTGAFSMFGKKAAPIAEEVVKSAGSGTTPPPYFFNLVNKIRNLGDDVTSKYATQERQKVTKYKDFELTEDIATGEKTIKKFKASELDEGPSNMVEETYMNYKPGKSKMDETTKGKTPPDEYTEDTTYIRGDGGNKGGIYKTVDGVADDVIEEGTVFEDNITEFGKKITKTKKASGGRVPRSGGGIMKILKLFKTKPETLREFIDRRNFLKLMIGNTDNMKNKRMLQEILEENKKVKGFEFPESGVGSDIHKKIETILSKDITKHADGGIARMLGE